MKWTFELSLPNCFGFRAFQSLRRPWFLFVHPLFTLYGLLYISLYILHLNPFKKTMKSLNSFKKQFMLTTLFWLSLNSLKLPEGQDPFHMMQKHPTQCRNFLKNKGTVRTIWKLSRHSGKFPHNLVTFKILWELSRQYRKFTIFFESLQTTWKLFR